MTTRISVARDCYFCADKDKKIAIFREALRAVANYGEKFREPEWYEQTAREALQRTEG